MNRKVYATKPFDSPPTQKQPRIQPLHHPQPPRYLIQPQYLVPVQTIQYVPVHAAPNVSHQRYRVLNAERRPSQGVERVPANSQRRPTGPLNEIAASHPGPQKRKDKR